MHYYRVTKLGLSRIKTAVPETGVTYYKRSPKHLMSMIGYFVLRLTANQRRLIVSHIIYSDLRPC